MRGAQGCVVDVETRSIESCDCENKIAECHIAKNHETMVSDMSARRVNTIIG